MNEALDYIYEHTRSIGPSKIYKMTQDSKSTTEAPHISFLSGGGGGICFLEIPKRGINPSMIDRDSQTYA